ncbi:MAG TPA: molybdopterin biosynthesis protein [Methanosarcinaceae archaeon]|nr:molybdopterin biosynthesis protein [Methanosarcinaceae archaeon]
MQRKEFRELISVEDAHILVREIKIQPSAKSIFIEDSPNHTIAEDIISSVDVPSFNRSVMDGYAVRAKDTYQASEIDPCSVKLIGTVAAGCADKFIVDDGEAVDIATGAPIPDGADAVVMIEQTKRQDNDIFIDRPVHIGENIMRSGSDIMQGERVLRKGTRIGSREIGVLSAIGKRKVLIRSVKVGIISTGDELIQPGESLEPGKIYDTNSYALHAGVIECDAIPIMYGIVRDNEPDMEKAIDTAVKECDIILTSGSTSAGAGDIMYKIIEEKGTTLAHGINIKPGKPVVIGLINGVPTIGLPGNPTSALTIFNEFVAPLIRRAIGASTTSKTTISAVLGTSIRSKGRHQLLPVGLVRGKVYPADKGSGAITTLADADGFIEIRPEVEFMDAGTPVDVTMFGDVTRPDVLFVGGSCPGIDVFEDLTGLNIRAIGIGSSGGFSAISNGTADIAGVNMPDASGEYNTPIIKSMGLSDVILIKGYKREQGLIVRHGSDISKIGDIIGQRLINRNRGSGTRALLDIKLGELAGEKGISLREMTKSITGYDSGAKTHRAVCEAVKNGRADIGFGLRFAADEAGLKFIKVAEEDYDLLVSKHLLEIGEIQALRECLVSEKFAEQLPAGIFVYDGTGNIVSFT